MPTPVRQYIATAADDCGADIVGDKAARLGTALRGGLPVPDWFVILPDAFFSGMNRSQHEEFATSREPAKIKYLAQRLQLSPRAVDEIAEAVNDLVAGDPDAYLAVRSSPTSGGDGHGVAPALYVRPDDVRATIVDIWRAAYAEETLFLLAEERSGRPLTTAPPAAIVQLMVRSDMSGAVFGGDPASGRRGVAAITAVYGLGGVAEATSDRDRYEVSRDGQVLLREIAAKQTASVFDQVDACGVEVRSVPAGQQRLAALSDSQVLTVADLVWRANVLFQRPQGLHWSFEAGRVFVLQTGPVAGLDLLPDPDGAEMHWDRRGFASSFPGIVTPLTFSVARWVQRGACRELAGELGLADELIRARPDVFDSTVGLIDGRVYRNTTRLRELLNLVPQPDWHKQQLAVAFGLDGGETPLHAGGLDGDEIVHLDAIGTGRMLARLKLQESRCEAARRDFEPRVSAALAVAAEPLDRLRPDELALRVRRIGRDIVDAWDAPSANQALAAIAVDLLRQLTQHWLEDGDGRLCRALVWNLEDLPGTHAAAQIVGMARSAARLPAVQAALIDGSAAAIDSALAQDSPGCQAIREALEAFLDRFGHVTPDGLKIEAAPLSGNPMPLLREIGALSRLADGAEGLKPSADLLPTRAVSPEEVRAASEAEERAGSLLSTHTWRRLFFHNVLSIARRRLREREMYEMDRSLVFGALRRLLIELGRRLYALGRLDSPRHVLFLELEEVLGFVDGVCTTTDLRGLVGVRWQEHASQLRRGDDSAAELTTFGAVYAGRREV